MHLYHLGRVFWVGSALHRSYAASHAGCDLDYLCVDDLSADDPSVQDLYTLGVPGYRT